jgi:hypothetical protein
MPIPSPNQLASYSASTTNEQLKAYHGLALRGPRGRETNRRSAPYAFSEEVTSLASGVGVCIIPLSRSMGATTPDLEVLYRLASNARGEGNH